MVLIRILFPSSKHRQALILTGHSRTAPIVTGLPILPPIKFISVPSPLILANLQNEMKINTGQSLGYLCEVATQSLDLE